MVPPFSNDKSTITATIIMLIYLGNRKDGAHCLRLMVSSEKKQTVFHRGFFKRTNHLLGDIECLSSKACFNITKGGLHMSETFNKLADFYKELVHENLFLSAKAYYLK